MVRDVYFRTFWLLYCGVSDLILEPTFSMYQVCKCYNISYNSIKRFVG